MAQPTHLPPAPAPGPGRRLDRSEGFDENEHYEGRAVLKSPNLACLDFQKVALNSKQQKVLQPYEQIRCTGTEVWQYRADTQQVFIYPLEKQQQKRALEE